MYDNLYCRHKSIGRRYRKKTFQTKSLDCVLRSFEISSEGFLLKNPTEDLWTRAKSPVMVKDDYTGDVYFYCDDNKDRLVTFLAEFIDGRLVSEIKKQPYEY